MNQFFKQLDELMSDKTTVHLTILKVDGKLSVSVLPKADIKDKAQSNIKPIVATGSPEELDSDFIGVISAPLKEATGLLTNISEFEESVAEASKKTDMEDKKKKAEKEDKKKGEDARKKLIEKAEKLLTEQKPDGALKEINKALEVKSTFKQKALEKMKKDATAMSGEGSLF